MGALNWKRWTQTKIHDANRRVIQDAVPVLRDQFVSRDVKLAALTVRIDELERRLTDLQSKSLHFCGIWKSGLVYQPNDATIRQGGLWIALRPTKTMPGTAEGSDDWQLAVKRGSVT